MEYRIVAQDSDGLSMQFGSKPIRQFSWRWLADHDESVGGQDPTTKQRTVATFDLPAELAPSNVSVGNGDLVINWDGQPQLGVDGVTTISLATLEGIGHDLSGTYWTAATAPKPTVSFNDIVVGKAVGSKAVASDAVGSMAVDEAESSDAAVADWLNLISEYGFCLVDDVPVDLAVTEQLINRIAPPLLTIFGTMWQVQSGSDMHADSAYTSEGLEPHTDGTYAENAPGFQLLHFIEKADSGGASVLVDGFAVAENIRATNPEAFEVLSTVSVPAHYIEDGVELRAERPPFRLDRTGQMKQVSFNNYDRSPMWLSAPQMDAFYHAYELFHHAINDPSNQLHVAVEPGQALVFDNWRVLHGRTSFTGSRKFQGAYIGRDEVDNRRRTLNQLA